MDEGNQNEGVDVDFMSFLASQSNQIKEDTPKKNNFSDIFSSVLNGSTSKKDKQATHANSPVQILEETGPFIDCNIIIKKQTSELNPKFSPENKRNASLKALKNCFDPIENAHIKSFDFSTPSPDDLVQSKVFENMKKTMNLPYEKRVELMMDIQTSSKPDENDNDENMIQTDPTNDSDLEKPQMADLDCSLGKMALTCQNSTDRNYLPFCHNFCIAGHVDSGKSTLVGKMLEIASTHEESAAKRTNKKKKVKNLAWLSDELEIEQSSGITVHSIWHKLKINGYDVSLIDSPGHADFIPNMVNSALKANKAILVVDSATNAFEKGFYHGGQTQEHLMILKTFGITKLIVAINKFDLVVKESAKDRFSSIVEMLSAYLKKFGFKQPQFIPCSAVNGTNFIEKSNFEWYDGPTLCEAMTDSNFDQDEQISISEMAMCVNGIINLSRNQQYFSCFSIGNKPIHSKQKLINLAYTDNEIEVKEIKSNDGNLSNIDTLGFYSEALLRLTGETGQLQTGDFLFHKNILDHADIAISSQFQSQVFTFESSKVLTWGMQLEMHIHFMNIRCKIEGIYEIEKLSDQIGNRKKIRALKNFKKAIILIKTDQPITIGLHGKTPSLLSNFLLRHRGETIGAGKVIGLFIG